MALFALQGLVPRLYGDVPHDWNAWYHDLAPAVIGYSLWWAMAPVLATLLAAARAREREHGRGLAIGWFALGAVPLAVLHQAVLLALYLPKFVWANGMTVAEVVDFGVGRLGPASVASLIELLVISAIFAGLEFQRHAREQERRLAELQGALDGARLRALRSQLHPHFLFNALHTVAALMGKNPKGQRVLGRLGELLRTMLANEGVQWVPLTDELRYLRAYLDIEEVRFEDRLRVTYEIDPACLDEEVPFLVLQPLVENAIKHGFRDRTGPGHLRIEARHQDGALLLVIEDDGEGCDLDPVAEDAGLGLENVRRRIALAYERGARLELDSTPGEGFRARLRLPGAERIRSAGRGRSMTEVRMDDGTPGEEVPVG